MTINDHDQKLETNQEIKPIEKPSGLETGIFEKAYLDTVAKVLNVPQDQMDKQEHKLRIITSFFKEQDKDLTPESLAWSLNNFQLRLGSPKLGEKLLDLVHKVIFLRMERDNIDKQLNGLGGNYGK